MLLVRFFVFFLPSGSFSLRLDWQSEDTHSGNTLEPPFHQPGPLPDDPSSHFITRVLNSALMYTEKKNSHFHECLIPPLRFFSGHVEAVGERQTSGVPCYYSELFGTGSSTSTSLSLRTSVSSTTWHTTSFLARESIWKALARTHLEINQNSPGSYYNNDKKKPPSTCLCTLWPIKNKK